MQVSCFFERCVLYNTIQVEAEFFLYSCQPNAILSHTRSGEKKTICFPSELCIDWMLSWERLGGKEKRPVEIRNVTQWN